MVLDSNHCVLSVEGVRLMPTFNLFDRRIFELISADHLFMPDSRPYSCNLVAVKM